MYHTALQKKEKIWRNIPSKTRVVSIDRDGGGGGQTREAARIPETIPTRRILLSLSLSLSLHLSISTTSLKSPGLVLFILRYPNDYPWNASFFSFGLRAVGRLFAMAAAIHEERRRGGEGREGQETRHRAEDFFTGR